MTQPPMPKETNAGKQKNFLKMYGKPFTKKEDKFLRDNCNNPNISLKQMSRDLKRSEGAARQRMVILGLVRPKEITEKFKQQNGFKKGQVSRNKGLKQAEYMSPESIEICKKSQFKAGHLPHNTKYNGHERLTKDGYIEVRVKPGKYVHKHRLIYEQHFGKIPKGMIVIFADGNSANFEPSNLKCISRQENMNRNSIARFPKELIRAIKINSKLKKRIDEYQKQTERS